MMRVVVIPLVRLRAIGGRIVDEEIQSSIEVIIPFSAKQITRKIIVPLFKRWLDTTTVSHSLAIERVQRRSYLHGWMRQMSPGQASELLFDKMSCNDRCEVLFVVNICWGTGAGEMTGAGEVTGNQYHLAGARPLRPAPSRSLPARLFHLPGPTCPVGRGAHATNGDSERATWIRHQRSKSVNAWKPLSIYSMTVYHKPWGWMSIN